MTSLATTACLRRTLPQMQPVWLPAIAGLACALAVGTALPVTKDAISSVLGPMCATAAAGSPLDKVEPVDSYPLPNVPGKRVTILRVTYGPGGFSRPHRHAGSRP